MTVIAAKCAYNLPQQKEKEINNLKEVIEEQNNQIAYYREQYQATVREKDEMRLAVEGFIRRSSPLDNTVETGKERSPAKSHRVKDLLLELESLEQERKKLKVTFIRFYL